MVAIVHRLCCLLTLFYNQIQRSLLLCVSIILPLLDGINLLMDHYRIVQIADTNHYRVSHTRALCPVLHKQ